jgi:hypothetical protein
MEARGEVESGCEAPRISATETPRHGENINGPLCLGVSVAILRASQAV